MSIARVVLAGLVVLACAVQAPAQSSVSVSFEDGRVTLSARNAPLRTILAEWSRVGGSRIVNAERIAGQPLTLELTDVTERDALSVLLRSVSGYIVAPRVGDVAGRSSFDRIFILPTSAPVRATPAAASTQPPAMNPLVFVPGTPEDVAADATDGLPRTAPVQRDPQQIQQQLREAAERAAALRDATEVDEAAEEPATPAPGRRATTPASPFGGVQGSTRPGEITPAPQQQTQPASPR